MRANFFVLAGLLVAASSAKAEFVGKLEFKPAGCQTAGACKLKYDFGYIDPAGLGWQAKAGLMTDGASIPTWAQAIIGDAWHTQFIRAAVVHDWYCIRTVRPRTMTHRMFYDALVESSVPRVKALTMYYAVLVGSHMWINLIEGTPCKGIDKCVQDVSASSPIPDAAVKQNESGELVAYRQPRFDQRGIAEDILEVSSIIEKGSIESPEDVEALARSRHPADFFLSHGDAIVYEGPSSTLPDR